MCGIAGVLGEAARDLEALERMTAALRHRGPDDSGIWSDPAAGVAFGHRRLSILDLSPQGHQPMQSADGRFVITFNGEIYNHADLRDRLEQEDKVPEGGWRGHSDTETLVNAIAVWGLQTTLERCAGMFALGIWDRERRRLSLARDRFGEKPLYYGWVAGSLVFASELKAFRVRRGFDNPINRIALRAFASRGYVPAPFSIHEGIFKLPPGAMLEIEPAAASAPRREPPHEGSTEGGLRLTHYWDYSAAVRSGLDNPVCSEAEALGLLEEALEKSIRRQAVADVPVGAFLSGGIDSSTVVALYQKYSAAPVRSYTIGFEEAAYNEADHAKAVAAALGTIHHEHYLTAGQAQQIIPLLPSMYDEPFGDSSQIPTYLVSAFARQEVTVALTGDGGDELFAGYRRHFLGDRIWRHLQRFPFALRAPMASALAQLPTSFWTRFARLVGKTGGHWGGVIQDMLRSAGVSRDFDSFFATFLDEWAFDPSPVRGAEAVLGFPLDLGGPAPDAVRGMYCDAMAYLPDDILCKVDRASMAVSLEARVPFLDPEVVSVAARIPLTMKLQAKSGKLILRKLLGQELPTELFERPKGGFSVPVGEWLRGSLRPWAEELLSPAALADGWFDAGAVRMRWKAHLEGRRDYSPSLWSVLMFQAWLGDQRPSRASSNAAQGLFDTLA
jgi:asparagine synthase (glutamine-hydrolysing)